MNKIFRIHRIDSGRENAVHRFNPAWRLSFALCDLGGLCARISCKEIAENGLTKKHAKRTKKTA